MVRCVEGGGLSGGHSLGIPPPLIFSTTPPPCQLLSLTSFSAPLPICPSWCLSNRLFVLTPCSLLQITLKDTLNCPLGPSEGRRSRTNFQPSPTEAWLEGSCVRMHLEEPCWASVRSEQFRNHGKWKSHVEKKWTPYD